MTLDLRVLAFPALLIAAVLVTCNGRELTHPPGVLVPEAPRQSPPARTATWDRDGYTFTPLAEFDIRARVIARNRFYLGSSARLSPVDLVLGWGAMSDQSVLDRLEIRQMDRMYWARARSPDVWRDDLLHEAANMHMIPANAAIARRLKRVRPGEVISLRGTLVTVTRADGWRWTSSLTRTDAGDGACELIYVSEVRHD